MFKNWNAADGIAKKVQNVFHLVLFQQHKDGQRLASQLPLATKFAFKESIKLDKKYLVYSHSSEFEAPKIPKIWGSHSSEFIFCQGSSFSDRDFIEVFSLILTSFTCKLNLITGFQTKNVPKIHSQSSKFHFLTFQQSKLGFLIKMMKILLEFSKNGHYSKWPEGILL